MSDIRYIITPAPSCAAAEAGSFLAQLADQSRRLTEDTRGLTPEDLEWQPVPGANTIGMLLAHLAVVEVFWIQFGVLGVKPDTGSVIGLGMDDDGMPLPEGAAPPVRLAGRDLEWFDGLLERARAYVAGELARLAPEDLDHERDVPGRGGRTATINTRWVIYHILEHFAAHYGQINLLRHLRRAATTGSPS